MIDKQRKDNASPIRFLPIFLVATLSVLIDEIQMVLHEAIVGNLFDDAAFSAMNLVEPYKMLVSFISYLICVGGAALIVRAQGARDEAEMQKLFNHCVTCSLAVGLFFFTVFFLFDTSFVTLAAGGSPAFPYAMEVFHWELYFILLQPLCTFLFTYILYTGRKWIPFLALVVQFSLNTVLSFYLGRSMGIGGATCAETIGLGGAFLIYCVYLVLKKRGVKYRPYVNPPYIKKLCLLGFPESSFILALSLLEAGVNALALNTYSIQGVAVVALIINLFMIVAYVSEGISEYETVATNWALGENNREEIRYGMRVSFRAVLMEGLFFSLLFLLAAPQIVDLFGFDDPETVRRAAAATRIMSVAPIAIIAARVTAIFHQYTEKIGRAIVIILLSLGLVSLALAALLSQIGLEYLILGIALGPVATIAFLWLFPSVRGRRAAIDLRRMTVVFGDEHE